MNHKQRVDIHNFVLRHDVTTKDQFICLVEEMGELADLILENYGDKVASDREGDYEEIEEEVGDILFIIETICFLMDIDSQRGLQEVIEKNNNK